MRTIYTKANRSTRLQGHRNHRARPFGGVVLQFTGLVLAEESCYSSVGFPVVLEDKRVFSGMMSSLNKYPGFNPQSLQPVLNIPNRLSGNCPRVVKVRSTSWIIHLGNMFVTLVIYLCTLWSDPSLSLLEVKLLVPVPVSHG